ncbi:carboxypeptidase-like regulatory domain-containing protein [Cryomorpha ignava]|uniref:Carboxypeptidase-like regulatory domain-containing protein n=1 Tax=Cryomorpha ignava TaxID=101383 RepID=A0A7K3WU94_9FLAO|nr:DUF5686 family protein [Cryomorpha ignava]NEN24611.1 carboxypeptidase-like regulatory domain-containing protein [Cryomorpha ignava]
MKFTAHLTIFIFCLAFFSVQNTIAQTQISGRIANLDSKEYIPFVHVLPANKRIAPTVSNIEGYFTLHIPAGINATDSVRFSCIGYTPYSSSVSILALNPDINMERASADLGEVVITAVEDPAYAIMRKVLARRDQNNPESLNHFKFSAYNKANIDIERTDSIQADLAKTGFENAHFMMLESATEVVYKKPGKWNEKVLAGKMSGIKIPSISLVSNSFQPFTCYGNYLSVAGFDYLNPISPNSAARYKFTLRDSAQVEGEKVYIISFAPRKNAAEELMEGTLSISANSYALVNFLGKNTGEYTLMYFEIRQAYTKTDSLWFPHESNTTYSFPNEDMGSTIIASSSTFIKDANLQYIPKKGDFGIADIQTSALRKPVPDSMWTTIRDKPLSIEESNTYAVYDTLPTQILNSMNWFMNQSEALAQGRLNFGKVDFLLNHLAGFNQYEGFRLGAGLATSQKLVKWMSAEGYAAYGFKDEAWKYGGGLRFFIQPKRELELGLFYRSDVAEPGRMRFSKDIGYLQGGETIRNLFIRRMNPVEQYEAALTYRPARGLKLKTFFIREDRTLADADYFIDNVLSETNITSTSIGLELRYAPGESLMQTGRAFTAIKQSYPRMRFLINQALDNVFDGSTSFTQLQVEVEHEFKIRGVGTTRLFGNAGKVYGENVPYPYLYFGRGGEGQTDVGILSTGYFQTMDLYEFLNDEYFQTGFIHNFGSIFGIKKSWSKPELKMAYMAAIGNLSDSNATDIPFAYAKMTKPYLEGGLMIDNILRMSNTFYYSGYGVGVFYRHGAYEMPKFGDNLSFIFSFAISL